jgi:hypothetical protein
MTEAEVAAIVEGIAPVTCEAIQRATAGLVQRQLMLEAQVAQLVAAVTDTGVLRERVATLEARPPLAGPAGQDGAPGPPGKDGTDGTPGLAYRGVFVEGQTYDRGQVVTWAGGSWHCNETTTTKPGEGLKAWTLMVKRGRDGKDGKDGPSGPPGPAGRDWQQVYDDTRRR